MTAFVQDKLCSNSRRWMEALLTDVCHSFIVAVYLGVHHIVI